MTHEVVVQVESQGAVSVTITVPLTTTMSIGAPVLGHSPSPQPGLVEIAQEGEEPEFHGMPMIGVNWDWGWYCRCYFCGCNRYMLLHRDGGPHGSWMAYCPVCKHLGDTPTDGTRSHHAKWPEYIRRAMLDAQATHPNEVQPPPRKPLKSS